MSSKVVFSSHRPYGAEVWRMGCLLVILLRFLAVSEALRRQNICPSVTCPQGFSKCRMRSDVNLFLENSGSVDIHNLLVEPLFCSRRFKLCVNISIQLKIPERDFKFPGHATLMMSRTSASSMPQLRKRIEFTAEEEQGSAKWLYLTDCEHIQYGDTLQISVGSFNRTVSLPGVNKVCSHPLNRPIKECEVPRPFADIDKGSGMVSLGWTVEDQRHLAPQNMCMRRHVAGKCRNFIAINGTVPLYSVAPCMCYEVLGDFHFRWQNCPFRNMTELWRNVWDNMTVSVAPGEMNDGSAVLQWNLSAPCTFNAQVWPCQLYADHCKKLEGLRSFNSSWRENQTGIWTSGTIVNAYPNLPLCVMVEGLGGRRGPWCPYDASRRRWIPLAIGAVLLLSLVALGCYVLRSTVKRWASKWDLNHFSQGARGHLLLLHSTDSEAMWRDLVCRLASALSALGFRVSLDLWSQAELCSLGSGPWLHSRLQHLYDHGGKVLVLLSPLAQGRAHAYWQSLGMERDPKANDPSDAFGAALSCILADRQKGHARERFVLVQLQSHVAVPSSGEGHDMPELLRGLRLYQLPRQTRGLLAELTVAPCRGFRGRCWRRWWLNVATQRVVQALQGVGMKLQGGKLAALQPKEPVRMGEADAMEKQPLQH